MKERKKKKHASQISTIISCTLSVMNSFKSLILSNLAFGHGEIFFKSLILSNLVKENIFEAVLYCFDLALDNFRMFGSGWLSRGDFVAEGDDVFTFHLLLTRTISLSLLIASNTIFSYLKSMQPSRFNNLSLL